MHRRRAARGFTLIELMVGIAVMAMLALMSWQGLDGMMRVQGFNRARSDAVVTLQTTLAQWGADLDATVVMPQIQPIAWNGQVLRLTRRGADGIDAIPVAHGAIPDGTPCRALLGPHEGRVEGGHLLLALGAVGAEVYRLG